ncbi:MAG: molybdopterin-binding protein [Chloroflexota bacterium]|nr:molybdopterin-binding protein [Chloroflexota bacterium]
MEPFTIDPAAPESPNRLLGSVITEEVKHNGRRLFRKGHRIGSEDLASLATIERPIHAVRLAGDDVHEDVAGRRLAEAVAGAHLEIRGPVTSRYNLVATIKGLLRVDREATIAINQLPGIAVFTLQDRLPVVPGKIVAGVKITPVAVPEATLRHAEALAARQPMLRVEAFRPLSVGVVTTEGLSGRLRERFQATVRRKVEWYGASLLRFEEAPNDVKAVAVAIERLIDDGADLILTGGGNTIDPLDPTLLALPQIEAEMVMFGAPAHPGSMFWLAERGSVPIFNLASCSMYSKATVADLVLPWVMAGERVTRHDLATLGYGGLLDRGMAFRFPDYEADATEEEDE